MFIVRPKENPDVKIVAVDLQLMAPLDGVIQIHGDITKVTKTPPHHTSVPAAVHQCSTCDLYYL